MKRIILLSLPFLLITSFSVQALEWAYSFIVWEGKVNEVKQEEIFTDSEIDKIKREVKTKPNDGPFCGITLNNKIRYFC